MNLFTEQIPPVPSREHIITEIQALWGLLLFLAAVIAFIRYPVPELPRLLDNGPAQLILVVGFVGLCWISVSLEHKNPLVLLNPLQSFVESQQKQARIQFGRQGRSLSRWASAKNLPKTETARVHSNRPMYP